MTDVVIDREQVFLLFATFAGDVEKTAHAAGIRAVDVLRVADEEGWLDRLKPILELKKSNKPGDIERAINRALNFSQAHRMRLIVERVLHKLACMTNEELQAYMFTDHKPQTGQEYKRLTSRALADLSSAMEKCQSMTYLALSDTVQDRTKRKEAGDNETAGGEMMVRIAEAMSKVKGSATPRMQLLDDQLLVAETLKVTPTKALTDDTFEGDQH